MEDDIAAVQAAANEIVDQIFGSDDSGSQFGIVTFNDTGSINTLLPLTNDQDEAIAGINAIRILGGGEEPLNSALLSILRGDAGPLDGAFSNRIIVFSDEPAADPELRPEVLRLASDLNANISEQAQAPSGSSGFAEITNSPLPEIPGQSVAIFPVLIGNATSTTVDFQELADETGGQVFSAADASEAVDAIIDAIDAPTTDTEILGTRGNDLLKGALEDDTIRGLEGNDRLVGQRGDDLLSGNAGRDTLLGGRGHDRLEGGNGVDRLTGGRGNDTIVGGGDVDFIRGTQGQDRFVITDPTNKHDLILDFKLGEDQILLQQSAFGDALSRGQLRRNQFSLGSQSQTARTRITYNSQNGAVHFDADGSGGGRAFLIAILNPETELDHRGFRVV